MSDRTCLGGKIKSNVSAGCFVSLFGRRPTHVCTVETFTYAPPQLSLSAYSIKTTADVLAVHATLHTNVWLPHRLAILFEIFESALTANDRKSVVCTQHVAYTNQVMVIAT